MIKVHAGPEALRRFRIRRKGWKMNKRQNKVTRTGWRYELAIFRHDGHMERETVTISRRNDKAVIDALLREPRVKRVVIRSLSKCIYSMEPDAYYSHSQILTMESVYID